MPGNSVNCSIRPSTIEIDNDITGIGVVIGYVATAGIVVLIITGYYLLSFQPRLDPFREGLLDPALGFRGRPNPVDEVFLRPIRNFCTKLFGPHRTTVEAHARLEQSLVKCMLSMSDIQIITGISILVSGAVQLNGGLSCYQWQIVVYLAWFSSLTHLSGLTLLRNYLYNRPAERIWRLCSMTVLIIMLIFAFVPTANYKWEPDQRADARGEPTLADYAICYLRPVPYLTKNLYWTTTASQAAVVSVTVSIILIVVGFISRLFKLHQNLSLRIDEQVRGRLSDLIRRFLRKVYTWCDVRTSPRSLKRTLLYRPLLALYLTGRLFLDLWASMLSEVLWLWVSFAWGVCRLITILGLYHDKENDEWSFGQVMSVALLAIPLVTMVEYLYPVTKKEKALETYSDSMPADASPNLSGLPGPVGESTERQTSVSRHELIDHPDWELYYSSGALTLPLSTTILGILPPIIYFAVGTTVGFPVRTDWLRVRFWPWGETLMVLIFCTWAGVLFSLLLSEARVAPRARWCVVGGLKIFVIVLLSASPVLHFWRLAFIAADIGVAVGLYITCALIHSVMGSSSV